MHTKKKKKVLIFQNLSVVSQTHYLRRKKGMSVAATSGIRSSGVVNKTAIETLSPSEHMQEQANFRRCSEHRQK
jgi:hypothetical protein